VDDTPDYVKKIQKDIWMAKSSEERERLTIKNNEDLLTIINELRKSIGAPPVTNLLPLSSQMPDD